MLIADSAASLPGVPRCIAALLFTCLLTVSGCTAPEESTDQDSAAQASAVDQQESCRNRLVSALSRMRPVSLRSMSRMDGSAGAFNAWLLECAGEQLEDIRASEQNLAFLEPSARRAASAPRFSLRDATYIRDSVLMAGLARSLTTRADDAGAESTVDRINFLHRWVGTNISLLPADEPGPPLGLLDTLLTGHGSLRSRTWVFASLLRQLEQDAVLLLPADADDESEFLIAVCLEGSLLLYDPHTWQPVTSDDTPGILSPQPAGAEYLKSQDGWSEPNVLLIAETPSVSPRMLVIQEQLPVDSSAVLYEEIAGGTSEIRPLVERVVAAAPDLLDATRCAWWTWPDAQVTAATARSEADEKQYATVMRPFEAPFERKPLELGFNFQEQLSRTDLTPEERDYIWEQRWQQEYRKFKELEASGDVGRLFGRPSERLLKIRLEQISGSTERRLIQQLQKIRNSCMDADISITVPPNIDRSGKKSIPIPEVIRMVNQSATGAALYWVAICQMDRGRPGTAITSFESYRRQYPEGAWFHAALYNQALCELSQGRREAAVQTLQQASQDRNPERAQADALLARVQRSLAAEEEADPAEEKSPESTESKPQESTAEEAASDKPASEEDGDKPSPQPESESASEPESDEPGDTESPAESTEPNAE